MTLNTLNSQRFGGHTGVDVLYDLNTYTPGPPAPLHTIRIENDKGTSVPKKVNS